MGITMSVLVLVSLVAATWAQQAPLPTPNWFLQDGFTGEFSERSAKCKEVSAGISDISPGPIVIPEDQPANIRIFFPPRPEEGLKGGWRHDRGQKGDAQTAAA